MGPLPLRPLHFQYNQVVFQSTGAVSSRQRGTQTLSPEGGVGFAAFPRDRQGRPNLLQETSR